jgi:hypothetical protein
VRLRVELLGVKSSVATALQRPREQQVGTDSGAAKAKRHADRQARDMKRKVRHAKHNARKEIEAKTDK